MEFELRLIPAPRTTRSPRMGRRAGSLTAPKASSLAAPVMAERPPLDDRHGLIRAGAALLAHVQTWHACGTARPSTRAAHPTLQPSRQQQAVTKAELPRWPGRGRQRSSGGGSGVLLGCGGPVTRGGASRSPVRRRARAAASAPAASVTVSAAGAAPGASQTAAVVAVARSRPLQQLVAGGVAGALSKTLVAPLERVSTMLMADGHRAGFGMGEAVAHAWRQGGLAGLFRGNAATLVKIVPASAIQFAVFHQTKVLLASQRQNRGAARQQLLRRGSGAGGEPEQEPPGASTAAAGAGASGDLSNAERLLAGAAAGAASVSVTYPLESARTLMSVAGGMEGSLLAVCRRVVAHGGVRALYKGFQATLLGDVMGNAVGFTLYEVGSRAYQDLNGGRAAPPSVRGVIGGLSAVASMTLTMPLEVARRRLQVQGTLGRPVLYRGTLDCLRQIARKEGLRGFYQASLPSYLKVAPSIGCMYFLYELLTRQLEAAAAAGPAPAPDS